MAVRDAMQKAAIRLAGYRPGTFFGSSNKLEIELCDLVNEVAEDVAAYQDWQALIRLATVDGDGETSEFKLPDDYARMLINAEVQELNSWFWGFHAYTDINAFMYWQHRGFQSYPGGWIIYGNKLRFSPTPPEGQSATYPYISKNWAIDASTAPKAEFTADTDTFALAERLLTLGLVWRWRENKKLDASGDQEAFIKALDEYAAKDKGSRVQRRNSRRHFPGTHAAWPWALGPSTYIDS